jgi:hypothetical protein
LLDELGHFEVEGVEVLPVDRTIDPGKPGKKNAEDEARGLLKQTGADVLIWGSVISLSGKSTMRLYWTPARDVPGAKSTGKSLPQTETVALPLEFWSDLKQILGLLVQSRIAALTFDQSGHYVADRLAPLIAGPLAGPEQGRRLGSGNPGWCAVQPRHCARPLWPAVGKE